MASKQQSEPTTHIAAVDLAPPGTPDNVGVFAFRAGDEIPQAWLDQHGEYIAALESESGGRGSVVRRAPLSEAQEIAAAGPRGAGGSEP